MTAKARTKVVLVNGDSLRVKTTFDEMTVFWAQMSRGQQGSAWVLDTITGHGTEQRVAIPLGSIFRLEEI